MPCGAVHGARRYGRIHARLVLVRRLLEGGTMRARVLAMFALAACGGDGGSTDVQPTLRFADRTDAEISRLVSAASATDGFQAQAQVSQFDDPFGDADPCPNVVEDAAANRVTITGGCATADGTAIEGSVELANPLGWGE